MGRSKGASVETAPGDATEWKSAEELQARLDEHDRKIKLLVAESLALQEASSRGSDGVDPCSVVEFEDSARRRRSPRYEPSAWHMNGSGDNDERLVATGYPDDQ